MKIRHFYRLKMANLSTLFILSVKMPQVISLKYMHLIRLYKTIVRSKKMLRLV